MLMSVIVLPVSAVEYEYVHHPPSTGYTTGDKYVYLDRTHENCAPSAYGAFVLLKIDKAKIEETIGRSLPSPEGDLTHAEFGSDTEYLTRWCACRYCKEFYAESILAETIGGINIGEKVHENNGETVNFEVFDGGWKRTKESYEVPAHFFLINGLPIEKADYIEYNNAKKEMESKFDYDYMSENTSYTEVYTDAEIEALFSGDKDLVNETLKCPTAIYCNGEIYTNEVIIQSLYNHYFMSGEMKHQSSFSQYNSAEHDVYNNLNENFDEIIGALVEEEDLFGYLVEQQAYYKKNPVGYNEYLLEALIIKLSEDYPDVEIPTAPQTGISTALLAVAALVSGAYVVKKRRR